MKGLSTFVASLLVSAPLLIATPALADELQHSLSDLFQDAGTLQYLGFESVQNPRSDQYGLHKYMVLDFRADTSLGETERQASVHRICTALLREVQLVRNLTAQGYDMVSVAFDRRDQYDCI